MLRKYPQAVQIDIKNQLSWKVVQENTVSSSRRLWEYLKVMCCPLAPLNGEQSVSSWCRAVKAPTFDPLSIHKE